MADNDAGRAGTDEKTAAAARDARRRRRDLRIAVGVVFGALAVFFALSLLIWVFGLERLGLK